MRAYVAVTDQNWFDFLHRRPDLDEVNFWTPKPWSGEFGVARKGELLLFKLKHPVNAIAGGGFFEHYTELPLSLAWAAFGEKNGAPTLEETRARISRLRREVPGPGTDYKIGCIILVDPFFWDREDWIPQPKDWSPQIVRGKGYDLVQEEIGRGLWIRIGERLWRDRGGSGHVSDPGKSPPSNIPGGYSEPVPQPRRIGQGTFQTVILDVYGRRCSVTREKALPTLDAAHIRPFRDDPRHYVRNGILLRSDVHRLFDSGYLTVTPDYRVEVSRRIRDDFDDGENYLKLHGGEAQVPANPQWKPAPEILAWHNESRYRG